MKDQSDDLLHHGATSHSRTGWMDELIAEGNHGWRERMMDAYMPVLKPGHP